MADETPESPPAAAPAPAEDPGKREVTPIPKAGKTAGKAAKAPKKASKAAKAPAKAAAKKAASTGAARAKSTIAKEGEMRDTFTGEMLPVTQFPTYKDKDGKVQRRTVARKNQDDFRKAEKARRAKDKAAKDQAKNAAKKAAGAGKATKAAAAKKAS